MLEFDPAATPQGERNRLRTDAHLVPTGTVALMATAEEPEGWALCDGAAISRHDAPELWALIGTSFGAGDGVTTFNLPNITAAVPPLALGYMIKL